MAGTDSSAASQAGSVREKAAGAPAPAIILVEPQLGENIGMVARAMLNCGLSELRLVKPREDWPNAKAVAAASGADPVLEGARLFASSEEAIADLSHVYATTARPRDMVKRAVSPRIAAGELRRYAAAGQRTGILFGKEAKGLNNDAVALAEAIITAPLNPAFSSLNLAMAVLLVGYEWLTAAEPTQPGDGGSIAGRNARPATGGELLDLFVHLERELDACGFLRVRERRPGTVRNLRNIFVRAALTEQEVRTLRGVIACLVAGPRHSGR
ncbi:MAG: RNA methyltransferase [Rhodospirillales bacterium]|nr:RNA methyltransferase [Rhodospirillales bacterium]